MQPRSRKKTHKNLNPLGLPEGPWESSICCRMELIRAVKMSALAIGGGDNIHGNIP
jgi:hypothetical protein